MEKTKFNTLVLKQTNSGKFYKCWFNGLRINEKELFERILKTENTGFRISHYVDAFRKSETGRLFNIDISEVDVS